MALKRHGGAGKEEDEKRNKKGCSTGGDLAIARSRSQREKKEETRPKKRQTKYGVSTAPIAKLVACLVLFPHSARTTHKLDKLVHFRVHSSAYHRYDDATTEYGVD